MLVKYVGCLAFSLIVPLAWSLPLNHDIDRSSLAAMSDLNSAVSGLNSRVVSRAGLLQSDREPRLPLPSPQDLETIKKIAQILIMLGEQVLPSTFVGRPSKPATSVCDSTSQDIPNDTVKDK